MFGFGTILPWSNLTLEAARNRLSGWHFAKESLTDGEREILYVGEGLLRLIDEAPEDLLIVSFWEKHEFDVDTLPRHVAIVANKDQARESIYADLARRGAAFSIESFEENEGEPGTIYAGVLNSGSDEGESYTVEPVPFKG